ncbi:MAG: hypothetical protein ACT6UL_00155 [Sphingopyxis sp.]
MPSLIAKGANRIMLPETNISARQKRVQQTVFREACHRGNTLKAIALDSGNGYTTVQSWANGSAVMSIGGLFSLIEIIPDDLLSMLLPDGRQIVRVPENLDHDEIETACRDFLAAKGQAHHPESECGREIGPGEKDVLDRKVVALRAA